jgi:UDP-N-acetylglucosamine acyltransferase
MKAHPTAIVSPKARIADDVIIGPHAVVEDDVEIGSGCSLHANTYVCTGTTLGTGCVVHMGACIGGEPQDLAYKGAPSYLEIGRNNIFREHVTVHRGTAENSATVIGDDNYFMCLSHIAHNCQIGNKVIICNNALLGGYVAVEDMVFISASCLIHQFVRVGTLAMLGGGVRLNKDFPPYMSTGVDNIVESYNIVGLKRAGFDAATRAAIKAAYHILYREGLNTQNAVEKLKAMPGSPEIEQLVAFIKSSKRGMCTARSNRNIA